MLRYFTSQTNGLTDQQWNEKSSTPSLCRKSLSYFWSKLWSQNWFDFFKQVVPFITGDSSFCVRHARLPQLKDEQSLCFNHPSLYNIYLCWNGGLYVFVVVVILLFWCFKTWHSGCQWSKSPLSFVATSLRVCVQPCLWPSPKSLHKSYSAAGEVASLRFLTNYTLHLWRKSSKLLAWSVFLVRWGGKLLREWKKHSWKHRDACLIFSWVAAKEK